MRSPFLIVLSIAVIFGGIFWYNQMYIPCDTPIRYRIGNIDDRFNVTRDDVMRLMSEAEQVWEGPLGTDLFVLDSDGHIEVNFIFDDRQQQSQKEAELRADIEAKEGMSEEVAREYERLIEKFRSVRSKYESRVVTYESKLTAYNEEVRSWNERGGAPDDVRIALIAQGDTLRADERALEKQAEELNALIGELNRIGARGNSLIADYNTIVNTYNDAFKEPREFAQGDYTGDAINIYEFTNEEELVIVLAHELGHALSLDHVEGEESIMHHLMEAQTLEDGLTSADVAEYSRMCVERGLFERFMRIVRHIV